jgi:hypothetical protein
MMAERDRPLADRRPDTAMDRLQPEAMLVRRPDLDRLVRMFGGFLSKGLGELFLKAASSSGLAEGWESAKTSFENAVRELADAWDKVRRACPKT